MSYSTTNRPMQSRQYWYESKNPHLEVISLINSIDITSNPRQIDNLRMARLYGNENILGLSATNYYKLAGAQSLLPSQRLTLNVIKSCIDTITSRIAKHKPRPTFLTNDGEWDMQQKAKKLNRFLQGVFYETDYYALASDAFRDACIFGTGFLKVFIQNGRIRFERVLPTEILVDSSEAVYGRPQSLFQTKPVNRSVLMAKFGKKDETKAAAIRAAANVAVPSDETVIADMVRVVEAWHLPSGPGAKDGKHAIVIDGCTLFEEEYTKEHFPFLMFHWCPPIVGMFGSGLAYELVGIQLEINKLLRQIQESHHLLSTPKVFMENGSKVVSSSFNNQIGAIIKYSGSQPTIQSFQTVHPEIYQHLENLYRKAYEIAGISQLAAQAKKPVGLDSGVALREFSDIESERFALVQQRYEAMAVQAALFVVEYSREIVSSKKSFKVKSPNKKLIDQLDFAEIDLDDSTYVLQCFPTNFLPITPAGRLQSVQELMNAGLIDRETGLSLLDFPDLEGEMSLANASRDDIMMAIDLMLSEGKAQMPDPRSNLQMALQLGQASYLKAKVNKVPQAHLELLQRWIDEVLRLLNIAQAAAMPPAAPGQVPPGAPPTPLV